MINRLLIEKVREVKRSQLCLIEGRSLQKPQMTNNSEHTEICQRELLGGGGWGEKGVVIVSYQGVVIISYQE